MSEDAPPKKKFSAGALLKKQGWSEGGGLGKDLQGRNTYVTVKKNNQDLGVGADMGKFKENDVKKHASILDNTLAEIARKKKEKKSKKSKKGKKDDSDDEAELPVEPPLLPLSGFTVSKAKLVGGNMEVEQGSEESDASSAEGAKPLAVMSDADLFSACRGARFGKLGRHSNSQKKIERIRHLEAVEGSVLVKEARERWDISKESVNQHRSPTSAPQPAHKKDKKEKKEGKRMREEDDTAPPAKRAKKDKKDKKEKKSKK